MSKQKVGRAMNVMSMTVIIHELLRLLADCPPETRFESMQDLFYKNVLGHEHFAFTAAFVDPDGRCIEATSHSFYFSWDGTLTEEKLKEYARIHGEAKLKQLVEEACS